MRLLRFPSFWDASLRDRSYSELVREEKLFELAYSSVENEFISCFFLGLSRSYKIIPSARISIQNLSF